MFLGRNFGTRNVRKPIKGSKDLDYSLVSNKNLSQKVATGSWCPGPVNLSQNGLKPTPLMPLPTKKKKIQNFPFKKSKLENLPHLLSV